MNALPLISGAFGLFHKDSVIAVGGYRQDALGEDMELAMCLHRHFRLQGKPYRIKSVAEARCWTEAPESRRVLKSQRVRWQRGLMQSVIMNRELLFHLAAVGSGGLRFRSSSSLKVWVDSSKS